MLSRDDKPCETLFLVMAKNYGLGGICQDLGGPKVMHRKTGKPNTKTKHQNQVPKIETEDQPTPDLPELHGMHVA